MYGKEKRKKGKALRLPTRVKSPAKLVSIHPSLFILIGVVKLHSGTHLCPGVLIWAVDAVTVSMFVGIGAVTVPISITGLDAIADALL